tara:strand:- start:475 stop:648 length:174 start_codon:yes stop_codon:yes gene_type:complete
MNCRHGEAICHKRKPCVQVAQAARRLCKRAAVRRDRTLGKLRGDDAPKRRLYRDCGC